MTLTRSGFVYTFGQVTSVSFFVISIFIYVPLCCHGIRQYYKYRKNLIIQKRHFKISMCFNIIMLFLIIIGSLLQLSEGWYYSWQKYGIWIYHPYLFLGVIASFIFALRVYMNYYDIQYSKEIISSQWKSLISPSLYINNDNINDSNSNKWYINHTQTFGNSRYYIKFIVLLSLIQILAIYILEIAFTQLLLSFLQNLIAIPPMLISGLFITYIRYNVPSFDDNFFIRKELIYCCYSLLIMLALNTIVWLCIYIINDIDSMITDIAVMFTVFIYSTGESIIIYVTTIWIINKNAEYLQIFGGTVHSQQSLDLKQMHSAALSLKVNAHSNTFIGNNNSNCNLHITPSAQHSTQLSVVNTLHLSAIFDDKQELSDIPDGINQIKRKETDTSIIIADDNTKEILNIGDVLCYEEGFESFIFHLAQEFSTEILLSYVEFTQFKLRVYQYFNLNDDNANKWDINADGVLTLPSSIPQSDIVYHEPFYNNEYNELLSKYNNNEMFKILIDFRIRSYMLYQKYIAESSEAEINIPHSMRNKLSDKMEDFNEWIKETQTSISDQFNLLYTLYDEPMEEMMQLLNFSFLRFQQTALFNKLQQDVLQTK